MQIPSTHKKSEVSRATLKTLCACVNLSVPSFNKLNTSTTTCYYIAGKVCVFQKKQGLNWTRTKLAVMGSENKQFESMRV